MKLSVVIPCLNEQEAIPVVLEKWEGVRSRLLREQTFSLIETIVVNDASTDGSGVILDRYPLADLRVIHAPGRLGYGGALKLGFQMARGDWIAFFDMDATYDPEDLLKMWQVAQAKDVRLVCGDRLSGIEKMPLVRKVGNLFFVAVIQSLFRKTVFDCCTGIRLFHRQYVPAFQELLPNRLNFTLAMTFLFLRFQLPFEEIPVHYDRRIGSSKLLVVVDGPRFLWTIARFWVKYRFHPQTVRTARGLLGRWRNSTPSAKESST